jgi:hypothetical protein
MASMNRAGEYQRLVRSAQAEAVPPQQGRGSSRVVAKIRTIGDLDLANNTFFCQFELRMEVALVGSEAQAWLDEPLQADAGKKFISNQERARAKRAVPPPQPQPAAHQSDLFAAELTSLKTNVLKKRARILGATAAQIDEVDDADDSRAAMVALVLLLRSSLKEAKVSELKKQLRSLGATEEQMDELDDAVSPKSAAAELLLQFAAVSADPDTEGRLEGAPVQYSHTRGGWLRYAHEQLDGDLGAMKALRDGRREHLGFLKIVLMNAREATVYDKYACCGDDPVANNTIGPIYEWPIHWSGVKKHPDGHFVLTTSCDIAGTFKENYELQSYPFDAQDLNVCLRCHLCGASSELARPRLVDGREFDSDMPLPLHDRQGDLPAMSMFRNFCVVSLADHLEDLGEWQNERLKAWLRVDHPVESCVTFSFALCISRVWYAYFWRVFFVLAAVAMSALVAFKDEHTDRVAHVATMFLTGVAFLNMVQDMVPNIPYLTFMDVYVAGTVMLLAVFMLLAALQDVYTETPREGEDNVATGWQSMWLWVWITEHIAIVASGLFVLFQLSMVIYASCLRHRETRKTSRISVSDRKGGMSSRLFLFKRDEVDAKLKRLDDLDDQLVSSEANRWQ